MESGFHVLMDFFVGLVGGHTDGDVVAQLSDASNLLGDPVDLPTLDPSVHVPGQRYDAMTHLHFHVDATQERTLPNPSYRNLAQLAEHYCEISQLNKEDPWRMRYAETIGKSWKSFPKAAWMYAAKDPIVTRLVWQELVNNSNQ